MSVTQTKPKTETYDEWRISGSRPNFGPWVGEWNRGEGPSARAMYDIRQTAKRNDEVWLQRRTVTTVTHPAEQIKEQA
jgi:hypothetical protein